MIKNVTFYSLFFIIISATVGCTSKKVFFDKEVTDESELETKEVKIHSYLLGLDENQNQYTSVVCPNGVYSINDTTSLLDSTLNFISYGVYSPKTIIFQCYKKNHKSGQGSSYTLNTQK